MQLVLAANTMENAYFPQFLKDAAVAYPQARFVVTGDLINVFPEPGEDFRSSIFYQIYGEMLPQEMARLHAQQFTELQDSSLIAPLHEFFDPDGKTYQKGLAHASRRYARIFGEFSHVLHGRQLFYIPGNMDYPDLAALFAAARPNIRQLDAEIVDIDGLRVAGIGGIPHSCQPFHEVAAISPYEVSDAAFERSLANVWGCDVLISHLSPPESSALESFVQESPVRLVICRAPFDLAKPDDCRGASEVGHREGKTTIRVRPFESPENHAFVVDVSTDVMIEPTVEVYQWRARDHAMAAPSLAPGLMG